MNVPFIEIGKRPEEYWNIRHLLPLPARTSFGNLHLKYSRILEQLDRVNRLAPPVFESYEKFKAAGGYLDHLLMAEELVYWLRKSADEFLALVYFLEARVITGIYPTKLEIDSIGGHLSCKNPLPFLTPHRDFLNVLNEVSNATKHSFLNSDLQLFGRDEPCIFALAVKRNNLSSKESFYSVAIADILVRFNEFFKAIRDHLQVCPLPHIDPPASDDPVRRT